MGINQQRISQITNNADFGNIGNLLAQGRNMEYIARHYNMDLALVWALRLEGKTDQEKFKEFGWGLRTWDQWYFNECDERFGDDWPGRIPAQLVAHTLENPDNSITIFDYHRVLSKTGWKVTHRIECPLSSERLSGNQVQKMQDKRILGTVGRTLLIAKRS